MSKVHIFWDNSNIHFVGLNQIMPKLEPNEDPFLFRTHFKNLFELAHRGREVGNAYLAGSIPPKTNSLWAHIESIGINVEKLKRTLENKENANDVSIQAQILRTAADNLGNNDTFVVLTGDGAGKELGTGFLADLERIHERFGFQIELIAWGTAGLNRKLREYVEQKGVFIPLEDHYKKVTYIKGKRNASPSPYYININLPPTK